MLRDLLRDLGLQPFLKTTGGKGLHVVVPVRATLGWDEVRRFCKGVAQQLEDRHPECLRREYVQGQTARPYLRRSVCAIATAPLL